MAPGLMQNTSMRVWVFSAASCLARYATAHLLMPSLRVNLGKQAMPPPTEEMKISLVFSVLACSIGSIFL